MRLLSRWVGHYWAWLGRCARPIKVRIVAVQPGGQAGWFDPLSPEARFVTGTRGGLVEERRDGCAADDVVLVSGEEAVAMAQRLSREEGVLCDMSSDAKMLVSLHEAERLGRGATCLPWRTIAANAT